MTQVYNTMKVEINIIEIILDSVKIALKFDYKNKNKKRDMMHFRPLPF